MESLMGAVYPGIAPAVGPGLGLTALFVVFVGVAVVWTLVWKGLALWRAAQNRQLGWFIALLIVHTLGILEIVYLLFFQKKSDDETQEIPASAVSAEPKE